ncbi:4-phosphopantetheinyl transferase [Rhodococcus rhodnii]|uniref:Uncharacterized protein n=2 Tax=Rhodococcus rhodnii TaxID=38312 RepID=R7WSW7_9NOCA|nr:4'-phosphopantetheinyl transferase superfamily protein [Rhodococcus rhodnii]EOM77249.1 hypothetical protein Rrhod_1398 [Rhodococcus rhodnii LMG 5362]TXG90157.1 4-phosphopantetheinyl transferase [Rhodococcus rhodnii]
MRDAALPFAAAVPIADDLFLARTDIRDVAAPPASHRALVRLLDCDYPRWAASTSESFRARFAATRRFAKAAVAGVAGVDVDDIALRRDRAGRPLFVTRDGVAAVADANLSHTGDAVVVAVSTRGRVGVDIEAARRRLDHGGFAGAICHPDELRRYHRCGHAGRNRMLLEVWTWKEATTKAMGTGLATAFPSLRTDPERRTVHAPRGERWRVYTAPGDGHHVAIARRSEEDLSCTN